MRSDCGAFSVRQAPDNGPLYAAHTVSPRYSSSDLSDSERHLPALVPRLQSAMFRTASTIEQFVPCHDPSIVPAGMLLPEKRSSNCWRMSVQSMRPKDKLSDQARSSTPCLLQRWVQNRQESGPTGIQFLINRGEWNAMMLFQLSVLESPAERLARVRLAFLFRPCHCSPAELGPSSSRTNGECELGGRDDHMHEPPRRVCASRASLHAC